MLNDKKVLITGGTGSFGKKCTEIILKNYKPRKLIIFSRDELKQFEMSQQFSRQEYPCMRYFIGDVRDKERLWRAFDSVDIIIHAAALKQVPAAEFNPTEAVKTNILGAQNVIEVAADRRVRKIIALSTDKAVNPINLYGATKLCADKMFIAANFYVGRPKDKSLFSVVRYGNVVGSRGSVIPLFLKEKKEGILPVTDPHMTRFWLTLDQGANFVIKSLERMVGGEIFIPKLPSMSLGDLAKAICPECEVKVIGIRPGEKLHEVLITNDTALHTVEYDDYFLIKPNLEHFTYLIRDEAYKEVDKNFEYSSAKNPWKCGPEEMKEMIKALEM